MQTLVDRHLKTVRDQKRMIDVLRAKLSDLGMLTASVSLKDDPDRDRDHDRDYDQAQECDDGRQRTAAQSRLLPSTAAGVGKGGKGGMGGKGGKGAPGACRKCAGLQRQVRGVKPNPIQPQSIKLFTKIYKPDLYTW